MACLTEINATDIADRGECGMDSEELCYLSAGEALRLFREKELSPVELMAATVRRAEATEPSINALAARYFDEALIAAAAAADAYASGVRIRALEGLPVAVKMDTAIAGQPMTAASMIFAEAIATHTDVLPQRIIDSGGIVHARTTTPEFYSASFTHSDLYGVTRNPWNLEIAPGGSSGGSAAALTSGSAMLATGSDNAGSIRIPASFCGVVGYKPPYGCIPIASPMNRDPYTVSGPLARTVADCELFYAQLAGPDLSDPFSLPSLQSVRLPRPRLGELRVAVSVDLGGFPVERQIAENTMAAAAALCEAGARVDEVSIPWDWAEVLQAGRIHLEMTVGQLARRLLAEYGDQLMPYVRTFAEGAGLREPQDLLRSMEAEARAWDVLRAIFVDYDVLICPTQGLSGFVAGDDYVDHGPLVDGCPVRYPFDTHMTLPFNIANTCPVLNVPSGFSANGVPTGVQVVGRPYAESSVFVAGAAIESAQLGPQYGRVAGRPRF